MYRPLQANVKTPSGTVSFTNLRYQVGNVPDANAKGQRSGTTAVITIDAELPTEIQDKAVKKVLLLMANGTPNCTAIAERTPHHRLYQALPESDPLRRPPSQPAVPKVTQTTTLQNHRTVHQSHAPASREIAKQPAPNRLREERKEYRELDRRKDQRKQNWRRDKRQ